MPEQSLEYTKQCETKGGRAGQDSTSCETSVSCKGAGTSSWGSAKDRGRAALYPQLSLTLGELLLFIAEETGCEPAQWLAQGLTSLFMTCRLLSPLLSTTLSHMSPLLQSDEVMLAPWVFCVISLLLSLHMCLLTLECYFCFSMAGE